ncbi:MAG: TonB-dependent receptor [Sinimarinibacterium sp.]|jgi:iron complex outermembrane receptor protein
MAVVLHASIPTAFAQDTAAVPGETAATVAPEPYSDTILIDLIQTKQQPDEVAQEPQDAQEPQRKSREIEAIVVTAQRREENLQDVPISVTAFSAGDIDKRSMTSFSDVARSTPGFVFGQSFGQVAPTIRGVGADRFTVSSEPGVALYVDDVYYGRPYLPQAALTSLERIEVLKGPQGTLYGRNTSGGALKLVSKRPSDEFEATAGVRYGSFDRIVGQGALSGPIGDHLRGGLSLYGENRDGYVRNVTLDRTVEGSKVLSARGVLTLSPWEWLNIDLNGDTSRQRDSGPVAHAVTPLVFGFGESTATPALAPLDQVLAQIEQQFGVVLAPLREAIVARLVGGRVSDDPRVVYQDAPTRTDIDSSGIGLTLAGQFANLGAKLILGYRDSRRDFTMDGDMTDFSGLAFVDPNFTEAQQFSAELQLGSDFEVPLFGGPAHLLIGAFAYDEQAAEWINASILPLGIDQLTALGSLVPPSIVPLFQNGGLSQILFASTQQTQSAAGFADLEWQSFDWLKLHLGGRYTRDDKKAVGTVREPPGLADTCENETQSKSFEAVTIRAGADLLLADDRMAYASYSEGFKSGGFNPATCNSGPYRPEYVAAIEVGLKSRWLDGSVQVNAAAVSYDYTDIQVEKVVGFATTVVNGPEASINGVELELIALPFESLSLDAGVAWLDARYGRFSDDDPFTQADSAEVDLSGNRLNKAPEWSGNFGLTLTPRLDRWGEVSARAEWSYTGRMFFDYFNHDFAEGPSYQIWNLYLNLESESGRWSLQAFGKNLSDEFYWAGQVTPSAVVGGPFTYFGAPRTLGIGASFKF